MRALPSLVLVSAAVAGCGDGGGGGPSAPESPLPARVVVTPASDTLTYGSQGTLAAVVYDESGAVVADAHPTWQSSAPAVVAVDEGGRLEGRGVGTARITARVGAVEGGADVRVEPARVEVGGGVEVLPYEIVSVAVPEAARPPAGAVIEGTIGGDSVLFTVSGGGLTFLAPALLPGTYPVTVELSPNEVGAFTVALGDGPAVTSPAAVKESVVASLEAALPGIAGDPDAAAAGRALAAFEAAFAKLTPAGQLEVARFLAANREVFEPPVWSEIATFRASRAAAAADDGAVEAVAGLEERVAEVSRKVEKATGLVAVCQRLKKTHPDRLLPAACTAEPLGAAATTTDLSLTRRLINWVVDEFIGRKPQIPVIRDGKIDDPNVVTGVRGSVSVGGPRLSRATAAAAAKADGPHAFSSGAVYEVQVSTEFRTPMDAEVSSGPLAPLGDALDAVADLWSEALPRLQELSAELALQIGLSGEPPALPSPPKVRELPIPAEYLSVGSISNPAVTCESGNAGGVFTLSCSSDSAEPQPFTMDVRFQSPLASASFTIEGIVQPGGSLAGSYLIELYDDKGLPVKIYEDGVGSVTLMAGSLELSPDGTYEQVFRYRSLDNASGEAHEDDHAVQGVYTTSDGEITFSQRYWEGEPDPEGPTFTGSLDHDRLTIRMGDPMTEEVLSIVYRRTGTD